MLHSEKLFAGCKMYSLFTAKRVSKNVSFYKKLGYSVVREELVSDILTFVYFVKKNNCVRNDVL